MQSVLLYSQANEGASASLRKKAFTTENFKLAAVLGGDISWAGQNGKTALISNNGNIDDENIRYGATSSATYFVGFDAYSSSSVVGFMGGVGLNFQKYGVIDANQVLQDSISTTNIEIPIYLKARFGNGIGRSQFWLAAGGGFSITSQATAYQRQLISGATLSEEIDIKDQYNSIPFLSALIGYEFMAGKDDTEEEINKDTLRFLLYAKANYDLGNRLNTDSNNLSPAISSYQDPSIEFLRVSLGIKILLRLGKAAQLMNQGLKEAALRQ